MHFICVVTVGLELACEGKQFASEKISRQTTSKIYEFAEFHARSRDLFLPFLSRERDPENELADNNM